MTTAEPSGRDLARLALQRARAAAKNTPARPSKPRRRTVPQRGAGRDPISLGAVVSALMADEGVDTALAGGTVLDQWETLAPELVGKVTAERFDAETGTLALRPATAAYGTQLRLLHTQMVGRINSKLGRQAVRSLRILPPGQGATSPAPAAASSTVSPVGPVRTRETASPGYHRALTAHQDHKPDHQPRLTPQVAAAIRAQDQALAARREPEEAFTGARDFIEALAAAADPHRRALARARAEKAGPTVPPARTA